MTPQTRKVHDLIQHSLRDPIREQIIAKSRDRDYRSFDEAKHDIIRYDALCSHKVIQDVVTEAVARAELHPFAKSVRGDKSDKADAERREIFKVASGLAAGGFTGSEFEALYAVATMPTDAERAKAAEALVDLHDELKTYVKNLGLEDAATAPPTLTRFRYVGELLDLESNLVVAEFRKSIKARMAERAGTPPAPSGSNAAPPAPPPVTPAARQRVAELLSASIARTSRAIDFRWEIRDHRRQE